MSNELRNTEDQVTEGKEKSTQDAAAAPGTEETGDNVPETSDGRENNPTASASVATTENVETAPTAAEATTTDSSSVQSAGETPSADSTGAPSPADIQDETVTQSGENGEQSSSNAATTDSPETPADNGAAATASAATAGSSASAETAETISAAAPAENTENAEEPAQAAETQTTEASAAPVENAGDSGEAPSTSAEAADGEATPSAEGEAEDPNAKEETPQYNIDELYPELVEAKKNNSVISVTGLRRVRGGILVAYKNMPMFLPTSHLSLKTNPSENELLSLIHESIPVHVHELSEDDKSRVIVTCRKLLRKEFLKKLQVGDIVEGKVSSLTSFGAFVNIGGIDGMVHVSRISRRRVNNPSDVLKKGDPVRAVIKEVDVDNERISLSMKELEKEAWKDIGDEFPVGETLSGVIRSLTDFGAYVELKPGIEGLVHISEMSWARRLKHPSEVFKVGQTIDVKVLNVTPEKRKISLSYKQTLPNPWNDMADRFSIGSEISGTVVEVLQRGVVVNIAEDVDAFLPKGKMHPSVRGKQDPFEVGLAINVLIMDVVPDNHSLIVGMEGFDQSSGGGGQAKGGGGRSGPRSRSPRGGGGAVNVPQQAAQNVTFLDLLSDEQRKKLFGDEAPPATDEKKATADKKQQEQAAESAPASAETGTTPESETNVDTTAAAETSEAVSNNETAASNEAAPSETPDATQQDAIADTKEAEAPAAGSSEKEAVSSDTPTEPETAVEDTSAQNESTNDTGSEIQDNVESVAQDDATASNSENAQEQKNDTAES